MTRVGLCRKRTLGVCGGLMAMFMAPSVSIAGAPGEDWSVSDVAFFLRRSLGYDAVTLAALDVPPLTYAAILRAAEQYADEHADVLVPLFVQCQEANAGLGDPNAAEDAENVIVAVTDAQAAIRTATSSLATILTTMLSLEAASAHSNVARNDGLDPVLRLLPLSENQRSAVWAATLARDAVVRNPYRRNRMTLAEAARARFQVSVRASLTQEQLLTLEAYEGAVEANLVGLLGAEQVTRADSRKTSLDIPAPVLAQAVLTIPPDVASVARWLDGLSSSANEVQPVSTMGRVTKASTVGRQIPDNLSPVHPNIQREAEPRSAEASGGLAAGD